MADQNFVDYVKICCRSGAGGAGSRHFARDPINPRGGPDGGDGGRGGHIILRANPQMWTLLPLKYRKHVIAGVGENGAKNNRFGKFGEDIILDVPLGTVVKDAETGEITHEINDIGQELILKHIERNAVLLFMIPADSDHINKEYEVLLNELELFNEELLDKPRLLAITKSDLLDDELKQMLKPELPEGIKTIFISAVTNKGLNELKDLLWQTLNPNVE